jgi:hypothetical protein
LLLMVLVGGIFTPILYVKIIIFTLVIFKMPGSSPPRYERYPPGSQPAMIGID